MQGPIAVVVGAWHTSALRAQTTAAADKALVKELPSEKAEATWVPWTDSRLSTRVAVWRGRHLSRLVSPSLDAL